MKKFLMFITSLLISAAFCFSAFASEYDIELLQTNVPTGRTGGNVNLSFKVVTSEYWDSSEEYYVYIPYNREGEYNAVQEDETLPDSIFPFEFTGEEMNNGYSKRVGKISKNATKNVSFSVKVRRDIPEAYYTVKAYLSAGVPSTLGEEIELKFWVKKSTGTEKETQEDLKHITFELGEQQMTPYGVYPQIMDFQLSLRNSGSTTASDVTASIICDSDSTKFPFDINETNYNRHFDTILQNETVSLPYSFAIRSETYSGYYPIKMKITFRDGSEGELKEEEKTFFVHIKNKEKETESTRREFNANDRVKARIIVDSFRTEPEEVYAGTEFELFVTFMNASNNVDASNVLLTFESEKVSESPVFTSVSGSNSQVIEKLAGGETATVSLRFNAAAGVDQRPYTLSISEKYDSPEFKNAEEKVSVTVPVKQIAKFNMGNVEVMPQSINVGDESNVMFAINNTGKIQLYNVMVKFESDSINTMESYIGNIKPGATGNVDVMLAGIAPTTDDGHVNVLITYEDEYGNITETKKDVILYVNETFTEPFEDFPIDIPEEIPWYKAPWVKWGGCGLLAALVLLVILIKRKKKKAESI